MPQRIFPFRTRSGSSGASAASRDSLGLAPAAAPPAYRPYVQVSNKDLAVVCPAAGLHSPVPSSERNNSVSSTHLQSLHSRLPATHSMDLFHKRKAADRSAKASPEVVPAKPARLGFKIESPPLVSHGNVNTSTGALLSGQMVLDVTDPEVRLLSWTLRLLARVTYYKPVHKDCDECAAQNTELKRWSFIKEPTVYPRGMHEVPFSFLFPGHLPASTHATLGSVDYLLIAAADSSLERLTPITRELSLARALMPPAMDRTAIRIFPPTSLRAEIEHPPLIHPIGQFNVHMRLTGLCAEDSGVSVLNDPSTRLLRRWRARKLNWRLEELTDLISIACDRHNAKVGGPGKGIKHHDERTVGAGELRSGWKTDLEADTGAVDGSRGATEIEFPCSFNLTRPSTPGAHPGNSQTHPPHHHHALHLPHNTSGIPPVCDVEDPSGLSVEHRLHLELVVAEEVAVLPVSALTKSARRVEFHPSGTARVLRMQFAIVVTERAGMGISWDEEQPPTYDDVPASPPGYHRMDDYVGEEIPANDLDLQR